MYMFRGSTEALEFAQARLTPFGKVQKYVEKLEVRLGSEDNRLLSFCYINFLGV